MYATITKKEALSEIISLGQLINRVEKMIVPRISNFYIQVINKIKAQDKPFYYHAEKRNYDRQVNRLKAYHHPYF